VKRVLSTRPSAGTLLAIVAIVLSIGGSATAASIVTSKQIKNNSITSADLKNNSIKSTDVKNGSLLKKDFKKSQLPVGKTGAAGAPGRNGTNGFGLLAYRFGDFPLVAAGDQGVDTAVCPAGTRVVGGGNISESNTAGEEAVNSSFPSDALGNEGTTGWTVAVDNNTTGDLGIGAYAICANASAVSDFPAVPKRKFSKR
jgi:hypothetical protein